jgi:adenylylsulfate kinase
MYRETHVRSVVKTVSWRVIATATTSVIVWLLTHRFEFALLVGGLDTSAKLVLYFLHERAWDKSHFGRKPIQPAVIWLTGLSKSGKAAIARQVAADLAAKGVKVEHLSGESVRDIFPETGFAREEREEHIRRVGYLASRLEKNGVFVVASFVSPFTESREFVRGLCDNFIEIHVATPLEACEERDQTGLYARARRGEVQHVVGLDEPYQAPERPHLRLDIRTTPPEQASARVLDLLSHHF